METKLLLIEIIQHEDFDEERRCVCCNKLIKTEYLTSQGMLGEKCFYKAIGLKTPTKKHPVDLPAEQLESLAGSLIAKFDSLNEADLLAFYAPRYNAIALSRKGISVTLKIQSYNTYVSQSFPLFVFGHMYEPFELLGISDHSMANKLLNTATIRDFLKKNPI